MKKFLALLVFAGLTVAVGCDSKGTGTGVKTMTTTKVEMTPTKVEVPATKIEAK